MSNRSLAVTSLSLSMLMPSLDTSIANVGLPALAVAFDASFQSVQWIVLTYLLAITTLVVGAGRLGDIIGRRRLMLTGISVFTVASLLSGLAPTLEMLLVARAAQGLGAAAMMALAVAFVGETVPKARVGSVMGLLGTMSAIGTTCGPSLGGLLMAGFDWRALFLVNVPLGVLTLVLAARFLPSDSMRNPEARQAFDYAGSLVLAVSLAAFALAMTVGRGHFDGRHVLLLSVTAAGAMAFVAIEARTASPVVRLEMFRDSGLRSGLAMSSLVSTVMMATLVVGPFYLSRTLGLAAAAVGFALSAGPAVSALTGLPAGRLVDRLGTRRTTVVSLSGIAGGASAVALLPATLGVMGYLAPLVVMTASYALFQAANNTRLMTRVDPDERGTVGGMIGLSRNLGLITGASAMGAVFAIGSASADITTATPSAIAAGMRLTFGVAAMLMIGALAIALRSRLTTSHAH
jgi:EmrB/QacA subfamily drug resistance transporter